MALDAELVVVGRITGVYGIRGWVRIASFTDPPSSLLDYAPWLIDGPAGWQALKVAEVRPQGKSFVARIEGCDDRDEARRFTARDLAVPKSTFPAAAEGEEFYWFDLEGLTVVTAAGEELGRVVRMMETGANDVMVVGISGGEEQLLPFVADVILDVDLSSGVLRVQWDPES